VTPRFLIYPVLFLSLLQLLMLLRAADAGWYRARAGQFVLLLAVCGAAWWWEGVWVPVAWVLAVGFVLLPAWLVRGALARQSPGWWRAAAALHWGNLGRLYRAQADACRRGAAVAAAPDWPVAVRGTVRLWHLLACQARGDWPACVALYESAEDWGTLAAATQARLVAARAFAELGQMERALRCLQFVVLSPRTLGALARQLWATRVRLAALAGDRQEWERLLADRSVPRRWRRQGRPPVPAPVMPPPGYAAGREVLRRAEAQAAPWRRLMQWSAPAPVTVALLVVLTAVWAADEFGGGGRLREWAGNGARVFAQGEWWRLWTALFLHGNWLHLAMNGFALWMFGGAIERAAGGGRMLALFLIAGGAGNLGSAAAARYDVAIGASSGVFGLLGAFGVAVWRLDAPIYATVRRRLLVMLGLMTATDLLIGALEPQVDNLAHCGGFVAGVVATLALWRRRNV